MAGSNFKYKRQDLYGGKKNAAQVVEIFKYNVRNADGVNEGSSTFDVHPGVLSVQYGSTITIDTYTKNIIIAGVGTTIRKLRYTEGSNASIDLTSDKVDVENFIVRDLTQGGNPNIIQLELTVSHLNPADDYLFDQSISVNTSALIRKEI